MPSTDQTFSILSRFLSCFRDEVQGHAARALSDAEQAALARLAAGQIADRNEREPLVRLLLQSSTALAFFAARVKQNERGK